MFKSLLILALVACVASSAMASSATNPKDEDPCSFCELVVGFAEGYIDNNATIEEVEEFLDNLCTLLPPSYSGLCDTFVNSYLPNVLENIANKDPPSTVCAFVGLCQPAPDSEALVVAQQSSGDPCSLCTFVAGALENFLSENTTQEEIDDFLDKLCNLLPSNDASECQAFVQAYLPDVIYDIDSNESPTVLCDQLGLCSSSAVARTSPYEITMDAAVVRASANVDSDACSLCEFVVSGLENYLLENTTESEVESFLAELCSLLPASDAQLCQSLVDAYLPEVIYEVTTDQSPTEVCSTELNLCSSERLPKAGAVRRPVKPELQAERVEAAVSHKANAGEGDVCSMCEFVASALENFISENSTEDDVEDFLNKLCGLLPGEYSSECTSFVDTYLPIVLYDIVNNESPSTLCSEIGVCSSKMAAKQALNNELAASDCSLCELVASGLENFITENTTETDIEDFLSNLCSLLPSSDQAQCTYLVDTYLPELIYDVTNNESPSVVCAQLGLCNSTRALYLPAADSAVALPEQPQAEDLCALCTLAVGYLESLITSQSTEYEIEKVLGELCDVLPGNWGAECSNFVDNELPNILYGITQNDPPAQLCADIDLCSNQQQMSIN